MRKPGLVSLMLVALLLSVGIGGVGCQSPEEQQRAEWAELQRGEFEQESEVLTAAFDEVVDAYLDQQEYDAGQAEREQVRERMLNAVPGLLLTTERMEEAFAEGEYPNAENQRRVNRLLDQMRIFDARLPGLTQMLVDRHQRGQLRDAELEILRRLLAHHMDGIGERLWPS